MLGYMEVEFEHWKIDLLDGHWIDLGRYLFRIGTVLGTEYSKLRQESVCPLGFYSLVRVIH